MEALSPLLLPHTQWPPPILTRSFACLIPTHLLTNSSIPVSLPQLFLLSISINRTQKRFFCLSKHVSPTSFFYFCSWHLYSKTVILRWLANPEIIRKYGKNSQPQVIQLWYIYCYLWWRSFYNHKQKHPQRMKKNMQAYIFQVSFLVSSVHHPFFSSNISRICLPVRDSFTPYEMLVNSKVSVTGLVSGK